MFSLVFAAALVLPADSSTAASGPKPAMPSTVRTEIRRDPDHPITQPPYLCRQCRPRPEGAVVLKFRVKPDGFVDPRSIMVEESSGFDCLDDAAVAEAAARWRFLPATERGKPITAWHRFRVVYEIKRSRPEEAGVGSWE